jgi:hypothetical protein
VQVECVYASSGKVGIILHRFNLFVENFELESLDDLTEIVMTLFSPIPNRGQEALPMIKEHPFGVDEKGVSCAPNLRILQKIMHPPCLDPCLRPDSNGLSCTGNFVPFGIPTTILEIQTY